MEKKRLDKKVLNQDLNAIDALFSSGRLSGTGAPVIGYGRKNVNQVRSGRRRK